MQQVTVPLWLSASGLPESSQAYSAEVTVTVVSDETVTFINVATGPEIWMMAKIGFNLFFTCEAMGRLFSWPHTELTSTHGVLQYFLVR